MNIRPFKYDDLDALIDIAFVAFAEESLSQGVSTEGFVQQVRAITRGRMMPFKAVSRLAGIRWAIFVAEVEGKIVGCGSYTGRGQSMELSNLMVHPDYRRRGIGRAILLKRLEHLKQKGAKFVTASVLATNEASLGNLGQQSFEVFDRYSIYEKPIDLGVSAPANELAHRPVAKSDELVFKEFEKQLLGADLLKINGTSFRNYHQSLLGSLIPRLGGEQSWSRVFTRECPLGFLLAGTSANQTKGHISRPIIDPGEISKIPAMTLAAEKWLASLGKAAVQISVPEAYPIESSLLLDQGWCQIQSWIRLVKWL